MKKIKSGKLNLNRESIRVLTPDEAARAVGGRANTMWTTTQEADMCTVTEKAGGCWVTSITAPQYC